MFWQKFCCIDDKYFKIYYVLYFNIKLIKKEKKEILIIDLWIRNGDIYVIM